MEKTLKKVVKTGYGLGLLSLKEGKRAAVLLKDELNLNDEESVRLAKELVHDSVAVSEEVLGTVQKYVEKAIVRSRVVDQKEMMLAKRLVKRKLASFRPARKGKMSRFKDAVMRKRW